MAKSNRPLPDGWRWARVGEVCDRIDYGFTARADFKTTGPRLLRITDIKNGRVNWDDVPGCQIDTAQEKTNTLADGDIVFARTGATTGKSFLLENPPRSVFASYLIRLRPRHDILSEYLYSYFQSSEYWRQIHSSARGGAQPNVNASLLAALALPLPSYEEQRRIAAILNEQMATAERARAAAEAQIEAAKALPAAYLRAVFESPEARQWPRLTLCSLCRKITDGTHQPPPFTREGVPFLFVRNVVGGRIDFNVSKYVSEETFERLVERCRPEQGDVLYTAVGSFGVAVVIDIDRRFTFQRHIAHLKLRPDVIDPGFLVAWINSPSGRAESDKAALGGAQRTVTLGALSHFQIPTPSLCDQRRVIAKVAERMAGAERARTAIASELDTINKLPAALLRRAFSGEL